MSATEALGAGRGQELSLKAPRGRCAARMCKQMNSPCVSDFALMMDEFDYFITTVTKAEEKGATLAERADGAVWKSVFGKPQWIEASAFATEEVQRTVLPGLQAFTNARTAAEALRAAANGQALLKTATTTTTTDNHDNNNVDYNEMKV